MISDSINVKFLMLPLLLAGCLTVPQKDSNRELLDRFGQLEARIDSVEAIRLTGICSLEITKGEIPLRIPGVTRSECTWLQQAVYELNARLKKQREKEQEELMRHCGV